VAKLLKVSKVRIRQICKQFQIDYDSNVSGVGNYIKAINDDIYLGWDPPCRNCSYQFEDKLDKDKKCWTCGKPQYWHDRTYPEAFTHLFFEHSL
jgi:predicted Zn-ribbon and HTH transcriptional regulator